MRRFEIGLTLALLCNAAPSIAQDGQGLEERRAQELEVRRARERTAARRRETIAPRQGERIRRDQIVPNAPPLARIGSRVANRLDTRLRTRLERTTDDGRNRIGVSRETLDDDSRRR